MTDDIDPNIAEQIDTIVKSCMGQDDKRGAFTGFLTFSDTPANDDDWSYIEDPIERNAVMRLAAFYATSMPFDVNEVMRAHEALMSIPPVPRTPLLWRVYDAAVEALLTVKWRVREFMGSKW